jgi:Co/Zn/Cd efflux system component
MPHVHSTAEANRGRLVAVFCLTLAIFAVEAIGGFAANSLALLADAVAEAVESALDLRSVTAGDQVHGLQLCRHRGGQA